MLKTGMKTAFRTPYRMVTYYLVLTAVCGFLCIGLNLKGIADTTLKNVLDNFQIVALPDFKANVTRDGTLAADSAAGDSVGYFATWAEGYDLEMLAALPGVKSMDVRNQFGAYVADAGSEMFYLKSHMWGAYSYEDDVVIFQLDTGQPVTIPAMRETSPGRWMGQLYAFPAQILWSAAGRDLTVRNLAVETAMEPFTLEPGKTYIMNIGDVSVQGRDAYHYGRKLELTDNGSFRWNTDYDRSAGYEERFPFCMEYTEDFWNTDAGAYFRQAAEAVMLNTGSVTAVTTSDVEAIPAFLNKSVSISQGRAFTSEEYENGERVCIISADLQERLGWQVGDTLDLSFYETQYLFSRTLKGQMSYYWPSTFVSEQDWAAGQLTDFPLDHIFDKNTFTIVGIYDGNICVNDERHGAEYLRNEAMGALMVLFPEKSIDNQPAPKLSPYTTTIRIEPLMLQKFLAAAQASGLMDQQSYGYQLGLTIDDHGLSDMISGLEALQQVSRLTLMLALITAVLAVAVLSILHLLQNRRQMAVLRSLGVGKGQAVACLLSGLLLVSLLGALCGSILGEKLASGVTQRIVDSAREDTLDSSFSAMLIGEEEDAFQLTVTAQPALTWWSAGSIFTAMLVLSWALLLWEAQKPPLLMLGVKE